MYSAYSNIFSLLVSRCAAILISVKSVCAVEMYNSNFQFFVGLYVFVYVMYIFLFLCFVGLCVSWQMIFLYIIDHIYYIVGWQMMFCYFIDHIHYIGWSANDVLLYH